MSVRLLYTLVFIFCLSAFASPKNECAHPFRDGAPCDKGCGSKIKTLPSKEFSGGVTEEFSTFQCAKFLYI
ncbi:MAG TPA: hypothetical protein VGM31_03170 [Puia sp.]